MSVLTAKDVLYEYHNSYQTIRAVDGVSCEFTQGKVYAIVGSSGSGKTTFLSLLVGLDVPTSGTITLNGKTTADMDRDVYRLNHVSVIYQNFNLFQHLTVLENAAYPLYVRKTPRKEADALAKEKFLQVGLKEDQFKRLPNMLSGGEQQLSTTSAASVTDGSWVTMITQRFSVWASCNRIPTMFWQLVLSKLPVGSSARMISLPDASARAMATPLQQSIPTKWNISNTAKMLNVL